MVEKGSTMPFPPIAGMDSSPGKNPHSPFWQERRKVRMNAIIRMISAVI